MAERADDLTWATSIFAALFVGIAFLVTKIGIIPDPNEEVTVLSQLVRHLAGDGPVLVLAQVSTALLLALAANTSFADFPRLSSFLARDGFMPRQFAFRGERLAFTTGIVALAAMAIFLCGLRRERQRPDPALHAGVFLAFTLSQAGMFVRWYRRHERDGDADDDQRPRGGNDRWVVAVVVGVRNFAAGAWVVVILVPLLMALLMSIRRHYQHLQRSVSVARIPEGEEVAVPPTVVVPIARLDAPARQAIAFANSISDDAVAVHVTNDPEDAAELRARWPEWAGTTRLVIVESPYRALVGPLLSYLDALDRQDPDRPVLVVLSEVVPRHWWENLLHNQTTLRLKLRLFFRRNTIVADIPYHLPPDGGPDSRAAHP